MKKLILILLALAVFLPAVIVLIGFSRMNDEASRKVLENSLKADCMAGSTAEPDDVYCRSVAQARANTYTDGGFLQQVFHRGTYGLVPPYLYDLPALREAEMRLEAEKYAQRHGANGSTRFTGQNEESLGAEIDLLKLEDPLTLKLAQQKRDFCDPSTGQIEKARRDQGDAYIDQVLSSGYCDDPAPAQ